MEAEYKARMSRKSCAYHRALKQAVAEGKTEVEGKALARAAAWLKHICTPHSMHAWYSKDHQLP